MPITSSAKKALRRDRHRQAVNYRVRGKVKIALDAIKRGSNSQEDISNMQSVLDTAVKKGVIHKNRVARIKSRLIKLVKTRGGSDMTKSKPKKKAAAKKAPVKKAKAVVKKTSTKKSPEKKASPKKTASKKVVVKKSTTTNK